MRTLTIAAALGALLLGAPVALAHQGNPNYRSVVTSVTPPVKGVDLSVLNFDDRLLMHNTSGKDVTIYDYQDPPKPYAQLLARTVREQHGATWGLSETGATGPTGNRYGDPAGHSCIAISGPSERVLTLRTGSNDRRANMHVFAERALKELLEAITG